MFELPNRCPRSRPRMRRNRFFLALSVPAAILLAGLMLPHSAWAQDCGHPAIFWDTGTGSFQNQDNFAGAGGKPPCDPLPTDNVTFGGTGFPQTGGIVTFSAPRTVNSLIVASQGWTFSLGAPVTATSSLSFGLVSLTLMGGNVLSTSPTGSIIGGTLIIPDASGVAAGIYSVNSLTLSGGGTATVLGGTAGSGANLFQVALSNQSNIDLVNNGPRASFVNIGGGTIDDSQVSMGSGTLPNVLWLAGENNNSTLTVSNGSVVTAQQLYVSAATGSTVTATGSGTRISALNTNVYGGFTLSNGATLSSGPLNLLTGAGGMLAIQSGAQVTSSSATVTGGAASRTPGFNVTGLNSLWTVNGAMSASNSNNQVSAGGHLMVQGGDLTLSSTVIKDPQGNITTVFTNALTLNGNNTLLDVSGNLIVADSGESMLNLQAGAAAQIAGNLIVANQNGYYAALSLDGSGTNLSAAGDMSVAVGPPQPVQGSNPIDPTTGLHTGGVIPVTVSNGAQLSASELTLGQLGYASLTIGAGSVVIDGSSSVASQASSEGLVVLNDTAASWQTNELTLGDGGKGVLQINSGNVTTSGDVILGNQAGSKGTVSITAGTLTVGGNLTVGNSGTGMFSEEPTGTLTVAGDTTIGEQTGGSGKMTLDGAFSLGGSLTVGGAAHSTGSVLIQLGGTNSGGGASVATPQVILGDQTDANGSLSLDGSGTAFETSSLTVGSFGMGKVGLTNGALLVSNGPVRVADQATSLIDAVTVASLSNFNVNNTLSIGTVGIGTMTLTTGGKVTSIDDLTLGEASGSSGLASVSGVQAGVASTVNYESGLIVGHDGTGELTVSGGGLVAPTATGTGNVEVGADAGSTGTVSISGVDAGSGLAARLLATNLSVGGTSLAAGGAGKVTVGTGGVLDVAKTLTVWSHDTVDVTGSGQVTVGTGVAAAAGTVRIDAGGTLRGPGTIVGKLVNAGGLVSPGDPVTLTVDGDYLQTGGVLDLQIAGTGPGEADLLAASGDVDITGGVVDLEFIDGYEPTAGAKFTLFSASDVELSNDLLEFDGAAADFNFTTVFDPTTDTYVLSDTGSNGGGGPPPPVSEPPPWMLLLLGFGLLALRRTSGNRPRPSARSRSARIAADNRAAGGSAR